MIYALGSNGLGQLGIGHTEDVSIPTPVDLPVFFQDKPVKRIVAGGNHTLILFETGHVLLAGMQDDERADPNAPKQHKVPVILDADTFHADISATWSASFLVTQDRRQIRINGTGSHAELGLGENVLVSEGYCRSFLSPVKSITSCLHHTVIILDNGECFGWGRGRNGQLGEPRLHAWEPRKIDPGFEVVKAVCGSDFTYLFGRDGRLRLLGADVKDRYGLKASTPGTIKWTDVAASWGGVAIQQDDKVISWGRNDHGQHMPSDLPPVKSIALGSEHWMALTKDGKVLTGGWGEHGNCGAPTDPNGDVKGKWNELDVGAPVKQIYAGCATSFLVT